MKGSLLSSPPRPRVGPLHSDREYDVSGRKEGFVLSPLPGASGDFKAFALAGVTFKVHHSSLPSSRDGDIFIFICAFFSERRNERLRYFSI